MDRSVTETMARAFVAFSGEKHEPALAAKARLCLKDFLGSALQATELPWVQQAVSVAAGASSGEATIIGSGRRASPENATFANAVAGHGLVRDDMHLGSVSHLGVVVLPVALAVSETSCVSGRALLDAIVVGYEAGGKLGRAIMDTEVTRRYRPTGTVGPFAAAAAAAKLAELDAGRFAAALGLAANLAAGYNEWATAGGTEMFFHPGFAARNALTAVRLAGAGAVVSTSALEGEAGMLAAFGKRWPDALTTPFADRAEILDVFFKEVPACNYAQTAAQAARDLAADAPFAADAIAEVVVRVPEAAAAYPGCDVAGPFESILQAKMSIQYNVALALLTGRFDEAAYLPARWPAIGALASRIVIEIDDVLTRAYPDRQGAVVSFRTTDGRRSSRELENVVAASSETVAARFLQAAQDRLGPEKAARLGALIDSLESLEDASRLAFECRL
jgi:2-methylcitrate dehydratase PrpD